PIFYIDLASADFESPFAIFHQRYSTNTQPSWSLAQPFRFVAHNGEINTISGNRRWVRARESEIRQQLGLPEDCLLLEPGMSDSASFDNALEVALRQRHSVAEAVSRLVPPAWEHDEHPGAALRNFLAACTREQEPWDGPAALIFSDGKNVGAKLDRNGLRPMRYTLTSDGLLVVGSEVGITDLLGKQVIERRRLGPGEMLLADPVNGIFFRPGDVPMLVGRKHKRIRPALVPPEHRVGTSTLDLNRAMAAFGWTEDQFRILFQPLVQEGQESLWSMGDDTPPAFLSHLPRPIWDYCKQRFAQVTNPPIDSLRESHVMPLDVNMGESAMLSSPLLDAGQMEALGRLQTVCCLDCTFDIAEGIEGAKQALADIKHEARQAATDAGIIVVTDRAINEGRAAFPVLLAAAAVWEAMVEAGSWKGPLIVESGQVVDTHHVALLIATGASAVHPCLALELAARLHPSGPARYRATVEKGLKKVLARMGISTLASYRNSQLFEVVGLDPAVSAEFFPDASQTLGGKSL